MEGRYRLLNLPIKDYLKDLSELAKIRNEIEHHFTQFPREALETSILRAFWIIKKFNDEYCQLDYPILFTEKTWIKLIEVEVAYTKLKDDCNTTWNNLNYKHISKRIFPTEQEDFDRKSRDFTLNFFSTIDCPYCQSDLIKPVTHNFDKNIDINMKCLKCSNTFNFKEIIEEILEKHYAYEIMETGSKGGVVPLSRCPKCQLGTFLSYENICIYCGNTAEGIYDPEFDNGLFARNVNDYSEYIS